MRFGRVFGVLCGVFALGWHALGASDSAPQFQWSQSFLGGGGYILSLMQDPIDTRVLYARCDVAGMFKSVDAGATWRAINNGMTESHHHSVAAFAMHPRKPAVLFRGSGEIRGHRFVGHIHKSSDGGETWRIVTDIVDYWGNGPGRMYGERISIDPAEPRFVAAGGFTSGVAISNDEGESFRPAGLKGEPIGFVAFHPRVAGRLYVGTLGDMPSKSYIYPNGDYRRAPGARLFRSDDRGATWNMVFQTGSADFTGIAFDPDNPEHLYLVARRAGLLQSFDGGKTFTRKVAGLPDVDFASLSVDPNRPNVLYAAADRRGGMPIPLVPLYRSTDKGEHWMPLKAYQRGDFSDYPSYIKTEEWIGWAISRLAADVKDPSKLYMSNWYGVSTSEDGGQHWSGHWFKGTETLCIENIVADPRRTGTFYFAAADHSPSFTIDNGSTYRTFARPSNATRNIQSSTAVVASRHREGYVLYAMVGKGREGRAAAICMTDDMGGSTRVLAELPNGTFVQSLREDPFTPGAFYMAVDGDVRTVAGLFRSTDWGATWEKVQIPFPANMTHVPHKQDWIENELLSVVLGQVKNVCGTNQLLAVDPHHRGTLYYGEWTEGIWRTRDAGKTWTKLGVSLPFGRRPESVLVSLTVDAAHADVVYAGFIREGLWRSSDGGDSWQKVFPSDDRVFNASSVVIGGRTADELFVACEPLYWSKARSAVVYSSDGGRTWADVSEPRLGAIRWKAIAVDRASGRIHGVACGNGAFYAEPLPAAPQR